MNPAIAVAILGLLAAVVLAAGTPAVVAERGVDRGKGGWGMAVRTG